MEWQLVVALVFGVAIVLFVPTLVWAMVVSGVYQVIRDTRRNNRNRAR
ncbi:MAG TPA: hypothetical protein G4O03_06980 [Dehalococcoidia bacterium]|nr:hypothetical protein [Dehalococcoidia bacterium]